MRKFGYLPVLLLIACVAGCSTQSPAVRTWLDERSALSLTAQAKPFVFSRDDFPAGVNLRDYANLGAFEVNRSGQRQLYLSLTPWSTLNRTPDQLAQTDAAFATLTVWADDQRIELQRVNVPRDELRLSRPVFELPDAGAHESYYPVTFVQLSAMDSARQLVLAPSQQAEGESSYRVWDDRRDSLSAFLRALPASSER